MADKKTFKQEKFSSLFQMEESVLSYWQDQKIFDKSLAKNPKENSFSFYDGPPFITGTPHYATLLPSIAKDIIPRYQTMKGKYVRRVWGWDVHGLPAENQVEKQLGLKVKKDIEKLGVDKFVAACRQYVSEVSDQWNWYIDHIGRWADMSQAYRTDQLSYMETVLWAFKQLHEQGLIYRGRRVSLYCPRCATPLSKFEVTMDEGSYKDVEDPAVTVAFRLLGEDMYILAWTTTPWTLPANLALAVDPAAEYVKVTDGNKTYILAHQALERYSNPDFQVLGYLKGSELVGESYEPLYSFVKSDPTKDYKIYSGEFVSMEDGTGVVHIAPGFGEDDTRLGEQYGLSVVDTIDDEGHFLPVVTPWASLYYRDANPFITQDLSERGHMYKEERVTHSYPHCYRCGTPLIYKSQQSWYLSIEPLRSKLLNRNQEISWTPSHFGEGRFRHNLETAPDWSLSRTRYWGTPIPVWETEDGEIYVAGSIEEIEQMSGQKITDLHRPAIDDVVLTLPSGKRARRVKEVLDCWFESGAMPYAQFHYPFENKKEFEQSFPTDFIVEYTGQLRGWFYYLHVLGNALKDQNAFTNVAVTGVLMGTDGRKMSKSYGNYPDPRSTIEKYGAEALRLYFMSSKIMNGEDIAISEEEIRESSRLLNILHNSFTYFITYSDLHSWQPSAEVAPRSTNVLDRWISVRLEELKRDITAGLDVFDFPRATKAIRPFIEDLSTWYIRRSRDRFVAGDAQAFETLYDVLVGFSLAVAPILPFSSDYFFRILTGKESVHLQDYPAVDEVLLGENLNLNATMSEVRAVASAGNMLRSQSGYSLRQPLKAISLFGFDSLKKSPELLEVIKDELNVKQVIFDHSESEWPTTELSEGKTVALDTHLTEELKREGRLRELLRKLQDARKKAGLQVGEKAGFWYFTADDATKEILAAERDLIQKTIGLTSFLPTESNDGFTEIAGEKLWVKFES